MTVTDLFVYPVKALAGIRVDSAVVTARGFEHDRRWMIVGPDGTFVSQRTMPSLARIRTAFEDDSIRLESETGSVHFPIRPQRVGARRPVTIWGDDVQSVPDVSGASEWLSDAVNEQLQLVWMPDDSRRSPEPGYSRDGDRVSFADAYPVLLTATESLAELNRNLTKSVPMNRFRPNIVVRTSSPWVEETWRQIAIGRVRSEGAGLEGAGLEGAGLNGVNLDAVKLCARCVVTTVAQFPAGRRMNDVVEGGDANRSTEIGAVHSGADDSGEAADRTEPLRTLARIHKIDGKAVFGVNLIPRSTGTVNTGDEVSVRRTVMEA